MGGKFARANALYGARGFRIAFDHYMKQNGLSVNSACLCGSNKKLKKCHLLLIWERPEDIEKLLGEMHIHEKEKIPEPPQA